ncbi:dUTP diphosphatase [Candidatus Pacearchaeota archaeon]|nr:dUTP diphosphatase [Candidatus Pacearchaeota archaeon]
MTEQKLMVWVHPDCPNKDPILAPTKRGDVGYDLKAWVENGDGIVVNPQEMTNVRTGVFLKLPPLCWGDIRPRSSTFAKRKLFVMGGTIDGGYVGEISVFIWSPTLKGQTIHNGDRLAQLVIMPRITPPIQLVDELPQTERGDSGFGSTGF